MLRQATWYLINITLLLCLGGLFSYPLRGSPHNNRVVMVGESQQIVTSILNNIVLPAKLAKQPEATIIAKVSTALLNTPYLAQTLIGSSDPFVFEQLVVDLTGVDCFTFLDYVIALSQSTHYSNFIQKLIQTRYTNGRVTYSSRRHFFSDWVDNLPINAIDITSQISSNTITVVKTLNTQADHSLLLTGIAPIERHITYIPATEINQQVIKNIETGNLIGIYTPTAGLDVTHVGIFIHTPQGPMFRNASSLKENSRVIDSPFLAYVKNTPGIIIYKVFPHSQSFDALDHTAK